jgi:hypothetical protein
VKTWYSKSLDKTAAGPSDAAQAAIRSSVEDFSKQMDSTVLPQFYKTLSQSMNGIIQRFGFTVSQMLRDRNLPENQTMNLNAMYLIMTEAARATAQNKGADIVNSMKSSMANNRNLAMWRKQIENLAIQDSGLTPTRQVATPAGSPGIAGAPQVGGQPGTGGSAGGMQSSVSGTTSGPI